ncbi:Glu-tRNA(Gln) amidotransferase GatDE subunit D [Candidatus Woesearchaeota archaeon]|nr:MAG: Glu-tRNA(Gln) amidotransferase GatDE subunit D [Candidatus Woesearchaeota archaeon]
MKPKPGDLVKVISKDEEFEGVLLERPEILDKNITVLKLDSGYNIGIDNKKIKKIEVKKAYAPKKESKEKLKPKKGLPTVAILSTGGTISSRVDYRTGGVHANYTAEDFVRMVPELKNIANLRARKIMSRMSEDFTPKDWQLIAREVADELNSGADGVVVTQGTDTMHFTTAALSFFLKGLSKPVVFTAAQRSIDRGSSDAYMNLLCSVIAAAKFDGAEVMTCMHATTNDDYCILIRGTKVRKMHTSRRDAFRPVNDIPLAKVYEDGRIDVVNNNFRKRSSSKTELSTGFEEKVALITVYPGMDAEIIDFYLNKEYKGLVIAATALGHVPTSCKNEIITHLKKAIDKKVVVVIASQTLYGRVHPLVYTNLRKLSIELGCIFAEDMLPETAYVKLGWALGHNKEKASELMLQNIAGEIIDRSLEDTYLY